MLPLNVYLSLTAGAVVGGASEGGLEGRWSGYVSYLQDNELLDVGFCFCFLRWLQESERSALLDAHSITGGTRCTFLDTVPVPGSPRSWLDLMAHISP